MDGLREFSVESSRVSRSEQRADTPIFGLEFLSSVWSGRGAIEIVENFSGQEDRNGAYGNTPTIIWKPTGRKPGR